MYYNSDLPIIRLVVFPSRLTEVLVDELRLHRCEVALRLAVASGEEALKELRTAVDPLAEGVGGTVGGLPWHVKLSKF